MATLVLSTLGTLVGGPIGSAVGALIGQQIDAQIFGSGRREGPRLKELAVTTSSYGTPIARHYGTMRASGSIIWSTDLIESKESGGGGKGQPKTTSYSYSSSFAVALSSRPITGLGRIWADGNLLRGAAGDLKTGGAIRIYTGEGDQAVDPLLQAAEGSACPAFRGTAYVVFEDLQLEDFGNRIPALTFEVIADEVVTLAAIAEQVETGNTTDIALGGLAGLSYEGSTLGNQLELVDQLFPINADASGKGLSLSLAKPHEADCVVLPEASAWNEGEFGQTEGKSLDRLASNGDQPSGLRYYDPGRDYQPGVQRVTGTATRGPELVLQFPGAISADNASRLLSEAALREGATRETLRWRTTELTEALLPGNVVQAPGISGKWQISAWEWREKGVELELSRIPPRAIAAIASDTGSSGMPIDQISSPTFLRAFEIPWDGIGSPDRSTSFVAASSSTPAWRGASLYTNTDTGLQPIGQTGRAQAVMGALASPLAPSKSLVLETMATMDVETLSEDHAFTSASVLGLANGENRLLVGNEIIQFIDAEQTDAKRWRLSGLLRGRGGTEFAAQIGHPGDASVIMINDNLVPVDQSVLPLAGNADISAIGIADQEPVVTTMLNRGMGTKPLTPVHARTQWIGNGGLHLCWTRRARGGWSWRDGIDLPLVEEAELYRIGTGGTDSAALWETAEPEIVIEASFISAHPGETLWAKQVGNQSSSDALALITLP